MDFYDRIRLLNFLALGGGIPLIVILKLTDASQTAARISLGVFALSGFVLIFALHSRYPPERKD